jgi:hypothetical protein
MTMWQRFVVPLLLPIAVAWVRRQERVILSAGVQLNSRQLTDARAAGVTQPERIRLMRAKEIPALRLQGLSVIAQKLGLVSPHTAGLTAHYGIFIRSDLWDHRALLVHEFAHTAQYERLGGIKPFLRDYLRECLVEGYPLGQLEREAAAAARRICR